MSYEPMIDHGSRSQDPIADSCGAIRPRRQYTIKGIESETVSLIGSAARHEGMKVGAWVSARLREAARNALKDPTDTVNDMAALVSYVQRLEERQQIEQERLKAIQAGLAEVIRAQHSIMTRILNETARTALPNSSAHRAD